MTSMSPLAEFSCQRLEPSGVPRREGGVVPGDMSQPADGRAAGTGSRDHDLHLAVLPLPHGCIPVVIQRWKTSILAAGQAPSQGMEPSLSRARISVPRARTSW
jgi:hypothetical protein